MKIQLNYYFEKMSEHEAAQILACMKEVELEKLFQSCSKSVSLTPLVTTCEEVLKDYQTLVNYYDKGLLLEFVKNTADLTRNQQLYANLNNPHHLYMYMQTVYSGFFIYVSLIIDLNRNLKNTVENIKYVFKTYVIALEKLIAIDYYPSIQNILFLKAAVFYMLKYNIKNDDLIIAMTKYAFSNSFASDNSKVNWINVLREYVVLIPEKMDAKFLLQKLCLCLRKLDQNYYGRLLIKSSPR